MVASVIVGRTPRQCRERFKNHVKEGIRKGPWSNEEDAAILQVQTREFSREGRGAATGSRARPELVARRRAGAWLLDGTVSAPGSFASC